METGRSSLPHRNCENLKLSVAFPLLSAEYLRWWMGKYLLSQMYLVVCAFVRAAGEAGDRNDRETPLPGVNP